MKNISVLIVILSVCILMMRCKNDESSKHEWPRVTTMLVTNISELGAQFNAEITYRGDFEILRYGFVWSQEVNPTLDNSEKLILTGNLTSTSFTAQITTTLGNNVKNHVRSFVETLNYTVYGKDVEFVSLGSKSPKITSFQPVSGSWGDTIKISGQNFSYISKNNIVKLGEIEAILIYVSDTLISIKIPEVLNQSSVKVNLSVLGNTAVSDSDFNYLIPEIISISRLTGTFLDTITIYGNNFGKSLSYNSVHFNLALEGAKIVSFDPSKLVVIVPISLNARENYIMVKSVGYQLYFGETFILDPPIIESFKPDTSFHLNEIIDIYGKNFNPTSQKNNVLIDAHDAEIIESSADHLKVRMTASVVYNYYVSEDKDVPLSVWAASQTVTAENKLNVHWESTWTKKTDFPGPGRQSAVGFAINGKGYLGTGATFQGNILFNDFWEYDPVADHWNQIENFPGNPRAGAVAFTIGDKGYVGTGSENFYGPDPSHDMNHFKDFYSYEPLSRTWLKISDFQGIGRHSAVSFVLNDEGYVGTGHWGNDHPPGASQVADDIWKYNPFTDSWTEVQKFPVATSYGAGFSVNNTGFVFNYNNLYKYDGVSWIISGGVLLQSLGSNVAFSILDKGYIGLCESHQGGTNALWEYSPVAQTFVNRPMDNLDKRMGASAFVIGNKAYIIGGNTDDGRTLNDVWEFDPSKPAL